MKNKWYRLITKLFLASLFVGLVASSVHAVELHTVENPSMQTKWHPVTLTENRLSDYYLTNGERSTYTGRLVNYDYNTAYVAYFSVGLYGMDHKKVHEVVFNATSLPYLGSYNLEYQTPEALPAGRYYMAIGVFDLYTGALLGWYPGYQYLTIAASH